MRKIFLNLMMIVLLLGLTACEPAGTKELVVFEDNIGLPNNIAGLYEIKKDNKKGSLILIIGYIDGKYQILLIEDDKEKSAYYKGIFVPSKIPKGNNYYAMSFSYLILKYFNHNTETKSKQTLSDRRKHMLLQLKYIDKMVYI